MRQTQDLCVMLLLTVAMAQTATYSLGDMSQYTGTPVSSSAITYYQKLTNVEGCHTVINWLCDIVL